MTKIKDEVTSLESKKTSRRKFFKAAAATGAVAAASLAMPNISVAQGTVTLKMQTAWGPADADPAPEPGTAHQRPGAAPAQAGLTCQRPCGV